MLAEGVSTILISLFLHFRLNILMEIKVIESTTDKNAFLCKWCFTTTVNDGNKMMKLMFS